MLGEAGAVLGAAWDAGFVPWDGAGAGHQGRSRSPRLCNLLPTGREVLGLGVPGEAVPCPAAIWDGNQRQATAEPRQLPTRDAASCPNPPVPTHAGQSCRVLRPGVRSPVDPHPGVRSRIAPCTRAGVPHCSTRGPQQAPAAPRQSARVRREETEARLGLTGGRTERAPCSTPGCAAGGGPCRPPPPLSTQSLCGPPGRRVGAWRGEGAARACTPPHPLCPSQAAPPPPPAAAPGRCRGTTARGRPAPCTPAPPPAPPSLPAPGQLQRDPGARAPRPHPLTPHDPTPAPQPRPPGGVLPRDPQPPCPSLPPRRDPSRCGAGHPGCPPATPAPGPHTAGARGAARSGHGGLWGGPASPGLTRAMQELAPGRGRRQPGWGHGDPAGAAGSPVGRGSRGGATGATAGAGPGLLLPAPPGPAAPAAPGPPGWLVPGPPGPPPAPPAPPVALASARCAGLCPADNAPPAAAPAPLPPALPQRPAAPRGRGEGLGAAGHPAPRSPGPAESSPAPPRTAQSPCVPRGERGTEPAPPAAGTPRAVQSPFPCAADPVCTVQSPDLPRPGHAVGSMPPAPDIPRAQYRAPVSYTS